jgi:hypothetical protein
VVLWGVGTVLVVLAVVLVLRTGDHLERVAVLVPTVVGVACALPYLVLVGYAAPRFLLPAYALLGLPAATGLARLVDRRRRGARWALSAAAAVGLAGHLAVQDAWLDDALARSARNDAMWSSVARVLADGGVRPPCTLIGASSAPVAYRGRCDSVRLATLPGDEPYTLRDLLGTARSQSTALVLARGEGVPPYARSWTPVPDPRLPAGWRVRVAPR